MSASEAGASDDGRSARADRAETVRTLSDQDELALIATSDPNPAIRVLAIWRLEDEELLRRIEQTDREQKVRTAAELSRTGSPIRRRYAEQTIDMNILFFQDRGLPEGYFTEACWRSALELETWNRTDTLAVGLHRRAVLTWKT